MANIPELKITENQKKKGKDHSHYFSKDYKRPRLDFFNNHCDSVVRKYNLDKIHMQGKVVEIKPIITMENRLYQIKILSQQNQQKGNLDQRTKAEIIELQAENLVLALGNDKPEYPDWVDKENDVIKNGIVRHLLDLDIDNKLPF